MKEITRLSDYDGNLVIYVQKCKKFKKNEWKTRIL